MSYLNEYSKLLGLSPFYERLEIDTQPVASEGSSSHLLEGHRTGSSPTHLVVEPEPAPASTLSLKRPREMREAPCIILEIY